MEVGERVKIRDSNVVRRCFVGHIGTIKKLEPYTIFVCLDQPVEGHCEWWFASETVGYLDAEKEKAAVEIMQREEQLRREQELDKQRRHIHAMKYL